MGHVPAGLSGLLVPDLGTWQLTVAPAEVDEPSTSPEGRSSGVHLSTIELVVQRSSQ